MFPILGIGSSFLGGAASGLLSGASSSIFSNNSPTSGSSSPTNPATSSPVTSSVLSNIFSSLNLNNLLGGLFDTIRCWGSTWTPRRAKEFMTGALPALQADLDLAKQEENPVEAINNALYNFRMTFAQDESWMRKCDDPARGCTRRTLQSMSTALVKAMKAMLDRVASEKNLKVISVPFEYRRPDGTPICNPFIHYNVEAKPQILSNILGLGGKNMKLSGFSWVWAIVLLGLFFGRTRQGKKQYRKLKRQF